LKQPLKLSFKHRPAPGGLELTLSFTNPTSAPVKVKACPDSRGGFVPEGELVVVERGAGLDDDFECRAPVERSIAPGKSLVGTVAAKRRTRTGVERQDALLSVSHSTSSDASLWAVTPVGN
jgi:hypothetical protein